MPLFAVKRYLTVATRRGTAHAAAPDTWMVKTQTGLIKAAGFSQICCV